MWLKLWLWFFLVESPISSGRTYGHWKGIRLVATAMIWSHSAIQLLQPNQTNGTSLIEERSLCGMTGPTQLPKYHMETVVGYFKRVGNIQIFHIWLCNP